MTAATVPSRNFGVEIECYMDESQSREMLAFALRAAGIPAVAAQYTHAVIPEWKIVSDGSLDRNRGCEVVSPVLSGAEGLEQVRKVCDVLKAKGCYITKECGLHVHVNGLDMTTDHIKQLLKCFVMDENIFDAFMPESRRGSKNTYVRSNRNRIGGGYNPHHANNALRQIDSCDSIRSVFMLMDDRYFKLNLQNMVHGRGFKTVEYRQHGGSIKADKVANWIEFVLHYTESAIRSKVRVRKSFDDKPEETLDPIKELYTFFKMHKIPAHLVEFFRGRVKEFREKDRLAKQARDRALAEAEARAAARRAEIAGTMAAANELISRAEAVLNRMQSFARRQYNAEGAIVNAVRNLRTAMEAGDAVNINYWSTTLTDRIGTRRAA